MESQKPPLPAPDPIYRYKGPGYLASIPARDLTESEIAAFGLTPQAVLASGLWEAPPAPKKPKKEAPAPVAEEMPPEAPGEPTPTEEAPAPRPAIPTPLRWGAPSAPVEPAPETEASV